MFVRVSNIFLACWDLWFFGTAELDNRNYGRKKDANSRICGEEEKGSGRETMKMSLRDGLWMVTWCILSELLSCLYMLCSFWTEYLFVLYHEAHEILSILQRPKVRASLSSGHTDQNISGSVSSYKVPESSFAEASHLPIDDRSHQNPSESLDTRESTKNADNNQSIALTQCDVVQMQLIQFYFFVILLWACRI